MSSDYQCCSNTFRPTLNEINKSLHNDKFSIKNRLLSIYDDHLFIQHVHSSYFKQYPLTANLRCGSWYVYPLDHSCYFKSTDGHFGKWTLNLRRLNPNVLNLVIKNHGIIIVDSTRKGKVFPDALQRTIPIWCHVLNNVFHILSNKHHQSNHVINPTIPLKMPSWIHDSEKQQIEDLAKNEWINKVLTSNIINELSQIQTTYGKRVCLEPFWIDRFTDLDQISSHIQQKASSHHIIPVILVTASRPLHVLEITQQSKRHIAMIDEMNGFNYSYIQGAGDDDEHWSLGISPAIFWQNYQRFLECNSNKGCVDLLQRINDSESCDEHKANETNKLQLTDLIVNCSSDAILRHTNNMLYAMLGGSRENDVNLKTLDMIKRLYDEQNDVCKVIDHVIICMDDLQSVQKCMDYVKQYEVENGDCVLRIRVYFVKDSKKYKRSLQNALRLMLNEFNTEQINKIWIYQDKKNYNVNVIGCVAASIILYCIVNGSKIKNRIDSAFWIKRDIAVQKDDNAILFLSKTKIRNVLDKFQFIVDSFHPSRLLMKQMNNYFLSF
eukprot:511274_1